MNRGALHVRELARALNAVSPLATLQRGYAIVIDGDNGRVVRSVAQAKPGTTTACTRRRRRIPVPRRIFVTKRFTSVTDTSMHRRHRERHLTRRIGWLRAAVLGANDGVVSTASLILGVAAAHASREARS